MSQKALEPTPEGMHQLVDAVMARLVEHVASLGEQSASDTSRGAEVAARLAGPMPEGAVPLQDILGLLFDEAIPVGYNAAGPGYMGYIPGGGIFAAAVADLIADAINRYVGVWIAAPGLVQLETNVLRWFCEIVGYPPESMGFLTSGGSIANLSAVIAARSSRLGEQFLDGVAYWSDQTHHSIAKAASLAGVPRAHQRVIPTDARQRIDLGALEAAIEADKARGLRPFLVAGNAGTTNTGAIDDLGALAELSERHGLWFHADAAYGGFFALTDRGKGRLVGLDRADSITLDPHKGLFLPFGTGALLARDRRDLVAAFDHTSAYMPAYQDPTEHIDFCRISPELSRDFRGLRVWLPVQMAGAGAFREALDEKLDLIGVATDAVGRMPGVEVVAPPQLTVVAFRAVRPGLDGDALDDLNRRWMAGVNARGRVMLTGTVLDGRFVLRICILSFRTHAERVEMALEDLRSALDEVAP